MGDDLPRIAIDENVSPGVSRSPNFHKGLFHVIGCGPGGPQTATLQALETIRRMDAILATERQARLFAEYIGERPVAFDPWVGFWDYQGKHFDRLTAEELPGFRRWREEKQAESLARLRAMLDDGLDVGLLEFGNPCLLAPSHWYVEQLTPAQVVIIPGMGAEAAALAALKVCALPAHGARFLLQSAPFFLSGQGVSPDMRLDDGRDDAGEPWGLLARHDHSLILYMALADAGRLFPLLLRHLPGDLPCAAVYWAGSLDRQRVVKGVLADMQSRLEAEPERFMGLLLLGRFLEGRPFTAAQAHSS